jgi:hypothetical protein
MMSLAFFAMINMIVNEHWTYIILPIGILIWGIFKFFDDNDREYLTKMGIDPDEFNAFFPDYYGNYNRHRETYKGNTNNGAVNGNTITWDRFQKPNDINDGFFHQVYPRKNPAYKGMVKKCKRNFKITVEEKKVENESEKERVYRGINSFFK